MVAIPRLAESWRTDTEMYTPSKTTEPTRNQLWNRARRCECTRRQNLSRRYTTVLDHRLRIHLAFEHMFQRKGMAPGVLVSDPEIKLWHTMAWQAQLHYGSDTQFWTAEEKILRTLCFKTPECFSLLVPDDEIEGGESQVTVMKRQPLTYHERKWGPSDIRFDNLYVRHSDVDTLSTLLLSRSRALVSVPQHRS